MCKAEYRNDLEFVNDNFGTLILAVRKDTAEAQAGADGDFIVLTTDELGRLRIAPMPAGDNNIGNVDVLSIAAGDNNIGNVDIASLPSVATSIKVSPVGGTKAVATSGTGVPLVASSTDAQMLFVQAKTGNTGAIYFGDSAVDKTSSKQTTLLQTQAITVSVDGGYKLDINEFFIDADNNDDGVDFLYL